MLVGFLLLASAVTAQEEQRYRDDDTSKWDINWSYAGIETFAHLEHVPGLLQPDRAFDIGIVGVPFDTAVSFRTGARFGPRAIRHMSQRQIPSRGFNPMLGVNPYGNWATVLDLGDVPVTPFDNAVAVEQMTYAFRELLSGPVATPADKTDDGKRVLSDGKILRRLLTLGGDHSISMPILNALHTHYGPISVLHFDSHLDTWQPSAYGTLWASKQSEFTHGSMFHLAAQKGYISNGTSVHAGLRTRLSGEDFGDYEHDSHVGFKFIEARDMDHVGVAGIATMIKQVLGEDRPVYLSIDIDVLDPSIAPGTGTPESGGWTMREMRALLHELKGLNFVGADIVEVSPAYDNRGETTSLAAADLAYEILSLMVLEPGFSPAGYKGERKFLRPLTQMHTKEAVVEAAVDEPAVDVKDEL
ncbi:hypothetical protein PYCC9005_003096 [Savitreella phatthalungensis]